MYKHIFLNPFYWFAVVWSGVLLLYPLEWTEAYAPLCGGLRAFFLAVIALSLVAGYFLGRYLKRVTFAYERPRYPRFWIAVILAGYAADFIYARSVPLFDELTNSPNTYMDFHHLPIVHVLVVTFSMFFGIYMFYCFLQEKSLRFRLEYLVYVLLVLLMFALLYNRGGLLMLAFIFFTILLSRCRKIRPRHIALAAVLVLVLLYLFGVFGNVRSGSHWRDTSYLISVANIRVEKVPRFLPKPFLWAYVYLISPLGNLNNLALHFTPTGQFTGVLSCILPDALGTRLFPEVGNVELPRVLDNLTVSCGFAEMYYFGGYPAMILHFAYMILLVCVLLRCALEQPRYFFTIGSLCCAVTAFMFFDNYLNFTGVLFAFVYPLAVIAYAVLQQKQKHRQGTAPSYPHLLPLIPRFSEAEER